MKVLLEKLDEFLLFQEMTEKKKIKKREMTGTVYKIAVGKKIGLFKTNWDFQMKGIQFGNIQGFVGIFESVTQWLSGIYKQD